MRSLRSAVTVSPQAPVMLRASAGVQAAEAAGLCAVAALSAADTASGQTYQASSGVGFVVFVLIVAAGLAVVASALARCRPWSRTPAILTQIIVGVIGIFLLQAGRYGWGVPALALAIAGLAGLLTPSSFKALSRE